MKTYVEPEEIILIEQAAPNLRDKLLIRMLFHLGCRVSEALGITIGDIDLTKGTVTIQHLKTRLKLYCPHCSARLGKRHSYCYKCGLSAFFGVNRPGFRSKPAGLSE